MWWFLLSLIWWCGTCAVAAPPTENWTCPRISDQPIVECSCDMPHTLRCTGDKSAMSIIAKTLRTLKLAYVSLLDCTVQNVSALSGPLLEGIALHGLVISSGEIKDVQQEAFRGLASPLQALGLPNNKLAAVPTHALKSLPELDRLDLSSNRMKTLEDTSFTGLRNLSFIDLSDNLLAKISAAAFDNLPQLKVLRLRGNRLTVQTISKLNPFLTVEELDLSSNSLVGPLGGKTLPKMAVLRDLQLSHNSLSSIKMGALQGLTALSSLSLQHNQIDVIEDHAFSHLFNLVNLELGHNRIVAVSGASLAHLNRLTDLDLRHNFLRALTADLVQPLKSLRNLRLDDNDISIVASDALRNTTILKHLTLSENPLNCDCSLSDFAAWLAASALPQVDKSSAVCTTPPTLENGLLVEVSQTSLVCGEEDQHQETEMASLQTSYRAKINLDTFTYDGEDIKLQWNVQNDSGAYTCNALIVYEEDGPNEVLVESTPLKCNSSNLLDPRVLSVGVPRTVQMVQGHRYRYCVVLFDSGPSEDDVSLILGCSDVIPLTVNVIQPQQQQQQHHIDPKMARVVAVKANLSDSGTLSVHVDVYPRTQCELEVALLEQGALVSQRRLDCSDPTYVFVGLDGAAAASASYRVCANVASAQQQTKPRCLTVYRAGVAEASARSNFTAIDVVLAGVFVALCCTALILFWAVRRVLLKSRTELSATSQCFVAPETADGTQQHNRYVKLQATTKL